MLRYGFVMAVALLLVGCATTGDKLMDDGSIAYGGSERVRMVPTNFGLEQSLAFGPARCMRLSSVKFYEQADGAVQVHESCVSPRDSVFVITAGGIHHGSADQVSKDRRELEAGVVHSTTVVTTQQFYLFYQREHRGTYRIYPVAKGDLESLLMGYARLLGSDNTQWLGIVHDTVKARADGLEATIDTLNMLPYWVTEKLFTDQHFDMQPLLHYANDSDASVVARFVDGIRHQRIREEILGKGNNEFSFWYERYQDYLGKDKLSSAGIAFGRMQQLAQSTRERGLVELAAIDLVGPAAVWDVACQERGTRTKREETRGAFGLTHTGWMTVKYIDLSCELRQRPGASLVPSQSYRLRVVADTQTRYVINNNHRNNTEQRELGSFVIGGVRHHFTPSIRLLQSRSSRSMGLVSFSGRAHLEGYEIGAPRIVKVELP